MTMILIVAALAAVLTTAHLGGRIVSARRRPRTTLDDILWLAKRERGLFGWRHVAGILRLKTLGIPLNPMISENWAALLEPGLRRLFHLRMRAREELFQRTTLYPVDTSQKASEHHQGVGELGSDGWNAFEDAGRVPYDRFRRGFKTDLTHHEFAKGIVIERKLMDDNLYPGAGIPRDINTRVEKLADSAAVKREKSAATLFNNAFTAAGVDDEGFPIPGADGVALCSASHPNGPDGQSGTQSNTGVLALTQDNVTATRILMRKFKDDAGELVSLHPDTLLVPPELEEIAHIVNDTPRDVGTNNNDVNVQQGRWNIVVWDYLTDATRWFMIDSMLRDQHLVWYDRIAPEFAQERDFDTLEAKFRGYMRYSRGFDDWRWIFGQDG
jgi:hypothetical protein